MIRVLIVDDEPLVRIGIKSTLSQCECNLEIVGEVSNGIKAKEILSKTEVDLVLTDIKMPEFNGVELIKWIKESQLNIKVVVLSCYNDFEFVREAFTYGAFDYILKYDIDVQSINNIVCKVKEDIDKERQTSKAARAGNNSRERINTDIRIIKNNILKELLTGGNDFERSQVTVQLQRANISFNCAALFRVVCFEVDYPYEYDKRFANKPATLCSEEVKNAISEYIRTICSFEIYCESNYRYFIILDVSEIKDKLSDPQSILDTFVHMRYLLSKYLNLSVSIGISTELLGYENLPELYKQALNAIDNKIFEGAGFIACYDNTNSKKHICCENIEKIKAKIIKEITLENFHGIIGLLAQLKKEFHVVEKDVSAYEVKLTYVSLVEVIKVHFHNELKEFESTGLEGIKDLRQVNFLNDLHDQIVDVVIRIANIKISILIKKDYSEGVLQSINYINTHFSEETLNLTKVAEIIGYSSAYTSRIFKQETGKYLIEYINEVRIWYAKKMLENPKNKVYQVAEKVGYANYNYFSRIFKKITGVSPSEYIGE